MVITASKDKTLKVLRLPKLWLDETSVSPYDFKEVEEYKFEPPSLTFATFYTE